MNKSMKILLVVNLVLIALMFWFKGVWNSEAQERVKLSNEELKSINRAQSVYINQNRTLWELAILIHQSDKKVSTLQKLLEDVQLQDSKEGPSAVPADLSVSQGDIKIGWDRMYFTITVNKGIIQKIDTEALITASTVPTEEFKTEAFKKAYAAQK
jgi:hypothetical protein